MISNNILKVNNNNYRDLRSTDLLLIDGLLEEMGPTVQHLMEKEGGNGLYPPPSFHVNIIFSQYLNRKKVFQSGKSPGILKIYQKIGEFSVSQGKV